MTLSKEQFAKLVENYVSFMMDGMDTETMQVMVFDLLTREYETYTEEQIVGEVTEIYGEEFATDLLESATGVPVWLVAHSSSQTPQIRAILHLLIWGPSHS